MSKYRIFGAILVILASLPPVIDNLEKVFGTFELANNYGFPSSSSFLYSLGAATTPILLSFSFRFKPHYIVYCIPVFLYSADFFWIFSESNDSQDYSYLYAFLFTLTFTFVSFFLNKKIKEETSRVKILEKLNDIQINKKRIFKK